jgi:hypothetical protein
MPPYKYRAIAFSSDLVAQERDIKLAALVCLGDYLRQGEAVEEEDNFWSSVRQFDEANDGLDTPSYDGIVTMPIPDHDLHVVERLGFRVL